ncbi:hypothetical protein E2562_017349 [Oryza meyeriana var. granulata]|uniref:Agenet domain-containing protein n=1 Tax=Oryza meyeriana var. granulata TaxID=110450 RepID=A0A6G1D3V2_9ORYZ|nr:hypothetical protein E2562_017349 [Oryza meyeriana var. granulata]
MVAGRSPALTGRRRRGRGRRWSKPPRGPASAPQSPSYAPAYPDEPPLAPGTEVEVRVDAVGFHGSWFEAVVEGFVPARGPRTPARYTASYAHLVSEDGAVLVEPFPPSHLRPRPPAATDDDLRALAPHDIVEAFHKDGWWSGIVLAAAAADDDVVTVAFPITREVITFPPQLVRPRRDYIDGGWVPSEAAIVLQPKHALRVYEVGDKVEVKRDREVYGHSWFPAMVAKVIDKLSYLVEYSDLEGDGEGGGKAVEYLHWKFIRPAEEHSPRECDFRLGPGAAVEAYCDGAWSPGVVRSIVGEGEYEVSVNGKMKELLLMKVPELLKPQYRWNGKYWRIVSAKRHLRQQSVSGKSPSSPVDVFSSDDEHRFDTKSSAWKRPRKRSRKELKEAQQLEVVLTEDSEHASHSEMNTPLSELVKSSGSNHSPKSCSQLSVTKNFQVLSKKIVSNCLVPVERILDDSSGHLITQNESGEDCTGKTVVNQEIISDMILMNSQLNASAYGTSADEGCAMLSTKKFRKQKMALTGRYNHVQQAWERPVSFQKLQTKKIMSFKLKQGKIRSIQAPQGRNNLSDNVQLKRNSTSPSKEIICALSVSSECRTPSPLAKPVSRGADSGSNTKFFTSKKKLARKKGFKESDNPRNSLDATSTVRPTSRKKSAGRLKGSSVMRQLDDGTHTQQQLDRTLEDDLNANEVTNQELLPLTPPGYESIVNGKHNHNGDVQTDNLATQVAEISHLMEKPMLSLDHSVEQEAPFTKSSPIWSVVEAMDVFRKVPQQPHFLPLKHYSPALREGIALGLTMSYPNVVDDRCLTKLLQSKSDYTNSLGDREKLKEQILDKASAMSRVDALLDEKDNAIFKLEQELGRLRWEAQKIAKNKEDGDVELSRLKAEDSYAQEACGDAEQQFHGAQAELDRRLAIDSQ